MILKNIHKYNILLASKSPRRQKLLKELGVDFKIISNIETNEFFPTNINIFDVPEYLARKKAKSYSQQIENNNLLITADTIVILNNEIINKPTDTNNAKELLLKISGNQHTVVTGVCLTSVEKQICFSEKSQVFFDKLTVNEINYYIEKYKPLDKAGAYGIQEWIGYIGIKKIEGSFYNIMGLPIQKLYKKLKNY